MKFLYKTLAVFFVVIIGFMTHSVFGLELATIAIWGGFFMLFLTGIEPEDVLKEVEWSMLFFFMGLFIIIGGLEHTNVIYYLSDKLIEVTQGSLAVLTISVLWFSALASAIIDSIPYTATMIKIVHSIAAETTIDVEPLWWALSLGACLGGNGSLIGASANLIVAGFARKNGVPISFKDFFLIGFPLMLLSVLIASGWMIIRYL